jgi:hypothetical protein
MAINFTQFDLKNPSNEDFLVGYKSDGSAEYRTTVSGLLSSKVNKNTNSSIIAQPGDNLIAKYNEAKILTPNGQALSNTNRATLIILPGRYTLASSLEVNTEFVDIVGLGSQKLDRGAIAAVLIDGNVIPIVVTANNVRIKGLGTTDIAARIQIGSNLPLQVFEDCVAGDNSFGSFEFGGASSAGTFINCKAGNRSFGSGGSANGTFINCEAEFLSFGTSYDEMGFNSNGIFKNCKAGYSSFSYGDFSDANGTYENCEAGNSSFGGDGSANGIFINCVGSFNCFGGIGTLINQGSTSGVFTNCTAGPDSFGTNNLGAIRAGKLYNCRLTAGTFKSVTTGGLMRNCIDGNNNIVDQ